MKPTIGRVAWTIVYAAAAAVLLYLAAADDWYLKLLMMSLWADRCIEGLTRQWKPPPRSPQ